MAEVTEVTNEQIIHFQQVNRILAEFRAFLSIVIRSYASDEDVANLVFTRASDRMIPGFHKIERGVILMIVADGDDVCRGIAHIVTAVRPDWVS